MLSRDSRLIGILPAAGGYGSCRREVEATEALMGVSQLWRLGLAPLVSAKDFSLLVRAPMIQSKLRRLHQVSLLDDQNRERGTGLAFSAD